MALSSCYPFQEADPVSMPFLQLSQTEAKAAGLVVGPGAARSERQRLDVAVEGLGLWRKSQTGGPSVRKSHTRTRKPFIPALKTDRAPNEVCVHLFEDLAMMGHGRFYRSKERPPC